MIGLLAAAFALGLFGSVHCIAMCGGLASVLAGGVRPDLKRHRADAPRWSILAGFHVGRIGTYAVVGAIVGALTLFAVESASLRFAQAALRALSGVLLVGVGLYLAGMFPGFAVIERVGAPLWDRLRPFARRLLPVRSPGTAVALGAVWGFVPCGMVYTALALGASTGSPLRSALVLVAFGAGTTPALLSLGAVATRIARALHGTVGSVIALRRVAGVVVASLGVMSVLAGFVAMPSSSSGAAKSDVACHSSSHPLR